MATYRCQWFYNNGGFGMSIALYLTGAADDLSVINQANIRQVGTILHSLLARGTDYLRWRASDVDEKRRVYGEKLAAKSTQTVAETTPRQTVTLRLTTARNEHTRIFQIPLFRSDLRPADWSFDKPPQYATPTVSAIGPLKDILGSTGTGGAKWSLRVRDKNKATNPIYDITDLVTQAGTNAWVVTTDGVFKQGQRVQISGIRGVGTKGINGPAVVTGLLPGGDVVISRKQCVNCSTHVTQWGTIRAIKYDYLPITKVLLNSYGVRKIGRATGKPLNRKRKACCA